jgi:RNA polymerase sigma factor (sigma-70 family)
LAFDEDMGAREQRDCEILLLEEALRELSLIDPRQGQIVELRYFAGMSEREVAEVLSLSRSTVTREWQTARAWLFRRLTREPRDSGR